MDKDQVSRIDTLFREVAEKGMSRRQMIQRASVLGISASALTVAFTQKAQEAVAQGDDNPLGVEPEKIAKAASQYSMADLAIVVVQVPRPTEKVPLIEQTYSAGAVCLSLLNAALAQGWGANWLSGWPTYDEVFRREGLGLADSETVAGIIHIGTPQMDSPDRPRPDPAKLTTWLSE